MRLLLSHQASVARAHIRRKYANLDTQVVLAGGLCLSSTRTYSTSPTSHRAAASGITRHHAGQCSWFHPSFQRRALSSAYPVTQPDTHTTSRSVSSTGLPVTCPGCGALSQESDSGAAGHYSRSRKAVKQYLRPQEQQQQQQQEGGDPQGPGTPQGVEIQTSTEVASRSDAVQKDGLDQQRPIQKTPICDRCHDLIYNSKGQSIVHPSVQDIADSIAESPFKRNHVFHVLDAADFPMSLFPKVFQSLELAKPRSQNRRSRHKFSTKPSVSFIITRSDLLAPFKGMADRMLPYFRDVLRSALGRVGRDMRMGNVHLVSAKRGWWTKEIKDEIWERGGGNWMVGRVNVGKSNLFEVVFPKGSGDRAPVYAEIQREQQSDSNTMRSGQSNDEPHPYQEMLAVDSLLPPAQPEVPFPAMPIVSSLPGTTASPIRLPFGGHRGELVDLPGLERGDIEKYVQPEHKLDLVMHHRPNVEQHIIKPGQSLLLGGGLVRITPQLDPNMPSKTMLAYAFIPIDAHVTSTEKAADSQQQQRQSGIKSILAEGVGEQMMSAGTFSLQTDVTIERAAPLIRAGVPPSKLLFKIYSTDILIEGVGWVELVCQVRRRRHTPASAAVSVFGEQQDATTSQRSTVGNDDDISPPLSESNPVPDFKPFASQSAPLVVAQGHMSAVDGGAFPFPQVEIFSPHGKHIAQRKSLGAWLMWEEGRRKESFGDRGRRPMSGSKKMVRGRAAKNPVIFA